MTLTDEEKRVLNLYFDWVTINISRFAKATSVKNAKALMELMGKLSL